MEVQARKMTLRRKVIMYRKVYMVRGASLMTNLLLPKMTDFHC